MSDVIIKVENLGKKYRIRHQQEQQRYVALRDVFAEKLLAPWRWLRERQVRNGEYGVSSNGDSLLAPSPNSGLSAPLSSLPASEDFWALRDVSFEVKQGDVVGIIGRNGAGKSTLLKVLSRITEPTEGRVRLRGRVASLLEVGTGFHPELTGRENIYLNGAVLGMIRSEIKQKFDEIVAFAEVEKFLDTPVKRYSSGMYVRLAFAVAAHLNPEVLIVDEVLAVGDVEFQKKCLGKMESVARSEGRTVLFVSHNMAAVESLCSSAILLSDGRVVEQGDTREIMNTYLRDISRGVVIPLAERKDRQGSGVIRFTSMWLANGCGQRSTAFQCGAEAMLVLKFENTSDGELSKFRVAVGIDNELGQRVLLLDSTLLGKDIEKVVAGAGVVRVLIPKLCLVPGRYHFTIFSTINGIIADWVKNAGLFEVESGDYFGSGQLPPPGQGLFVTDHTFLCDPETSGEDLIGARGNCVVKDD